MFTYKRAGWRKVRLTGLKKRPESGNLIIPSVFNGRKVVSITKNAFRGLGIKKLTIPSSVELIEHNAFAYNQISTLNFGENLINVDEYAFEGNPIRFIRVNEHTSTMLMVGYFGKLVEFIEAPRFSILSNVILSGHFSKTIKAIYIENEIDQVDVFHMSTLRGFSESKVSLFTLKSEVQKVKRAVEEYDDIEVIGIDTADEFRDIIKVSTSF